MWSRLIQYFTLAPGDLLRDAVYRRLWSSILISSLGGQITMQMGTFFFVAPFIKSQRVRALGITSAQRMPQLPEIPTIAEQGYPGYEVHSWWGIVAPAGVPPAILQRLHDEMKTILATADMRERLDQLGVTVRASPPDEFRRYLLSEMQLWGKVVRDAKISSSD